MNLEIVEVIELVIDLVLVLGVVVLGLLLGIAVLVEGRSIRARM